MIVLSACAMTAGAATFMAEGAVTLEVTSTLDGEPQPCAFVKAEGDEPRPLLVFLHPWSHGYNTFNTSDWSGEARRLNWSFLQPHFRGPNNQPMGCGSKHARQDILDALDHVLANYAIDETRVYIAGGSGGGHMTMVMAAHAPGRWAAASAWCGITDLAAWHRECKAKDMKYYKDIEGVVGGAPGDSAEIDADLRYRSPVFHLSNAKDLPVDIATGIHDGYKGSVPVHHTLDAFNTIARALEVDEVSAPEIAQLSREEPLESAEEQDPTFDRAIYLRRYAGPSRVTIFEGGHEGLAKPGCAWLATHHK